MLLFCREVSTCTPAALSCLGLGHRQHAQRFCAAGGLVLTRLHIASIHHEAHAWHRDRRLRNVGGQDHLHAGAESHLAVLRGCVQRHSKGLIEVAKSRLGAARPLRTQSLLETCCLGSSASPQKVLHGLPVSTAVADRNAGPAGTRVASLQSLCTGQADMLSGSCSTATPDHRVATTLYCPWSSPEEALAASVPSAKHSRRWLP